MTTGASSRVFNIDGTSLKTSHLTKRLGCLVKLLRPSMGLQLCHNGKLGLRNAFHSVVALEGSDQYLPTSEAARLRTSTLNKFSRNLGSWHWQPCVSKDLRKTHATEANLRTKTPHDYLSRCPAEARLSCCPAQAWAWKTSVYTLTCWVVLQLPCAPQESRLNNYLRHAPHNVVKTRRAMNSRVRSLLGTWNSRRPTFKPQTLMHSFPPIFPA